jgi:hypothetical protein
VLKYIKTLPQLLIDFILWLILIVGVVIFWVGIGILFCVLVYTLYIWWGVISNLGFIAFILSICFFFISIPLSPIYLGTTGNWEATFIIIIGIVLGSIIIFVGLKISSYSELKTERRLDERKNKLSSPVE